MRRWLWALLSAGLLFLVPFPAQAADPIVRVVYPAPSRTDGTLVFQTIPWHPGDKIEGSIEVAVSQNVRNLVVQPSGGAFSMDETSRRVIPRHRIQFYRSDTSLGALSPPDPGAREMLSPTNTYMFDFIADGIPGEDTYRVSMEATGEVLDADSGQWHAFQETLPSVKLKAFNEAKIQVPGKQLTEQWTNMHAPYDLLAFFERFLDLGSYQFFFHYNPQAIVSITLPGNPHVKSSVEHELTVTLDPVLDEHDAATPWVHLWMIGRDETQIQGVNSPRTQIFDKIAPNETVQIAIYREHKSVDGRVISERIPPGIYRSNLHIRTDWGSEFVLPVELRVRDHPFWSILALVLGVALSLLANYWQSRQPLYQAQMKAKRLQRLYIQQGLQLGVVERVIQRLNRCLVAGDAEGVTRVNGLLEELVDSRPETMIVEALFKELESTPGVNWAHLWVKFLDAASLEQALREVKQYCATHTDPAVRAFVQRVETLHWEGAVDAFPPFGRPDLKTWVRQLLSRWSSPLFVTGRVTSPGLWDHLTVLILFVMMNGGLIALQLAESYGPNLTFGSAADYLNLLLWGFAGDATRTKLTSLAGNLRGPGERRTAGSGASATPAPPPVVPADAAALAAMAPAQPGSGKPGPDLP